jgi:penicillin G amidase
VTAIHRYRRLLILLAARLGSSLFPGLPLRLGLKRRGRETVGGIEASLSIIRDPLGIPTIHARSPADLFFGFGYAITQDRLWQMDLYRRTAAGRLSEVLGNRPLGVKPGSPLDAGSTVELDCLHRALGFFRAAQASRDILSLEATGALDRYTAGVNAALAAMQEAGCLPPEFYLLGYEPEPWTSQDSLAIGRLIAWMLCLAARAEMVLGALAGHPDLFPLLPVYPANAPVIVEGGSLPDVGGGGSNSWVVGPNRTRSGHPLLCNDPHLPMGLPGIFYQVRLQGGGFQVSGVTMPGLPGIVIGANADIAWGITSAMPDDADVYRESIHASNPHLYEVQGEWRRLKVAVEEIAVRGGPSKRVTIRYVPRGAADCPLLSDVLSLNAPVSLRWTGLEPSREMDALLLVGRARNLEEFREALRHFTLPAQNFLYADRRGTIAYFCAGRFPKRREGDGPFPMDGSSGDSEWRGEVPFDELPSLVNPPSGVIVTANHRIVDEAYPHELTYLWEPPYRARRILELLGQSGLDVEEMARMQNDVVSLQAKAVVGQVLRPAVGDLTGRVRHAADRLLTWDFRMGAESPEAALYHVFYERLRFLVFADRLNGAAPELYRGYFSLLHLPVNAVDRILAEGDAGWMPAGRGAMVSQALEETLAFLEGRLGAEAQWAWGGLHALTLRHPLGGGRALGSRILNRVLPMNRGPFSVPGDGMTINVSAYLLSRPFDPGVGPAYRQIVDCGDAAASRWIIPGGSSGDPLSPHYGDQLEDWRHGRYHPMMPDAVIAAEVLELVPCIRQRL